MRWRHYVIAASSVILILAVLRLASIDRARVAAPLLLLNVVVSARFMGIGPALVTAIAGAAGYSYDFLPPAGFAIEDPDDWVAFFTFLVTAIVAGELASRAERRALEAQAGRKEIERLYSELQAAFDRTSEAEAARRNEQLKAALLDALTHNLRTPLTAIKASVTALIGAGPEPTAFTTEGQHELLEIIDEESDRLNRFIEGLSATDAAPLSQPVHLRAVGLDQVVRAALVRAETVTRGHSVVVDMPERLPNALIDSASIVEVLYMLIDNASKYSPEGTRITVRVSPEDDRYVRISVSDEGPGIPPELRKRVFEKFFRVPARKPYDHRRGGIGLGLSIALRLVEAQAGHLWIDEPLSGRGTTVAMTLPLAPALANGSGEPDRRQAVSPGEAGVAALAETGSGINNG